MKIINGKMAAVVGAALLMSPFAHAQDNELIANGTFQFDSSGVYGRDSSWSPDDIKRSLKESGIPSLRNYPRVSGST